ncbi:MAG: hypothetical protein K2J97_01150, partial [Muribaculaceae bacterium]|nr:hypothetical protein [Muribaculaceae bacterium]
PLRGERNTFIQRIVGKTVRFYLDSSPFAQPRLSRISKHSYPHFFNTMFKTTTDVLKIIYLPVTLPVSPTCINFAA